MLLRLQIGSRCPETGEGEDKNLRLSSESSSIKIRSRYDDGRIKRERGSFALGSHGRQFERRGAIMRLISESATDILIIRSGATRDAGTLTSPDCGGDIGVSIAEVYQIYSGGIGSENNSFNAVGLPAPAENAHSARSISDDVARRDVLFTGRVDELFTAARHSLSLSREKKNEKKRMTLLLVGNTQDPSIVSRTVRVIQLSLSVTSENLYVVFIKEVLYCIVLLSWTLFRNFFRRKRVNTSN